MFKKPISLLLFLIALAAVIFGIRYDWDSVNETSASAGQTTISDTLIEDMGEGTSPTPLDELLTRTVPTDEEEPSGQMNPETLLEDALALPLGTERSTALIEAATRWATEEPELALTWIEANLGGRDRLDTLQAAIQPWAEDAPESAAEWVRTMVMDGSQARAAHALALAWAKTDPEATLAWIDGLSAAPVRSEARAGLVESWSEHAPEATVAWLVERGLDQEEAALLRLALDRFVEADHRAAGAFISAQASSANFPALAERYIAQLVEQQGPETAQAWIEQQNVDPHQADLYHRSLFYSWAQVDPADAATLLDTAETVDHAQVEAKAFALMSEWARTDTYASAEWLSRQAAGPVRDAAIEGFSNAVLPFDPVVALEWSQAITSAPLRTAQLQALFTEWAQADPGAAGTWLENTSAETEATILSAPSFED